MHLVYLPPPPPKKKKIFIPSCGNIFAPFSTLSGFKSAWIFIVDLSEHRDVRTKRGQNREQSLFFRCSNLFATGTVGQCVLCVWLSCFRNYRRDTSRVTEEVSHLGLAEGLSLGPG
ncbi:hypothetical protein HOLleu_00058 [Holothuria leucospilota]|uniref:Uncharacterized protein n=1 Tax=Holothuria leucospilota TaxID=206669 RepID=A0A9Q1CMC7_HOLLE|nr:hypothetical protein HOLleu_00058 [Holothuria leucospilota]